MNILKKNMFTFLIVITLSFAFVVVGNMVGDNTPSAMATVTNTEAGLCLDLNTYVDSGNVDMAGFLECLAIMNQD